MVGLEWKTKRRLHDPQVSLEASSGMIPYPYADGANTYSLHLLSDTRYTIHAEASCHWGKTGKARTGDVTIDSVDSAAPIVTRTFDKGTCQYNGVPH